MSPNGSPVLGSSEDEEGVFPETVQGIVARKEVVEGQHQPLAVPEAAELNVEIGGRDEGRNAPHREHLE